MFPQPRRFVGALALAGALGALLLSGSAQAQVTVAPTVTSVGSVFNYSYSVTNLSANELFFIDFVSPTQPDALTNLMAPDGFQIAFTPDQGLFTFLPSDPATTTPGSFSPGSVVSGFSFDSTFAPTSTTFSGIDSSGGTFTGTTLTPNAAPVPEAGTLVSLGIGLLFLGGAVLRRRTAVKAL